MSLALPNVFSKTGTEIRETGKITARSKFKPRETTRPKAIARSTTMAIFSRYNKK